MAHNSLLGHFNSAIKSLIYSNLIVSTPPHKFHANNVNYYNSYCSITSGSVNFYSLYFITANGFAISCNYICNIADCIVNFRNILFNLINSIVHLCNCQCNRSQYYADFYKRIRDAACTIVKIFGSYRRPAFPIAGLFISILISADYQSDNINSKPFIKKRGNSI